MTTLSTVRDEGNNTAANGGIKLFHSGDEYFAAVETAIDRAQAYIYLESYIFADDQLGLRILTTLGRAVQRGVDVRILVDGIGSYSWTSFLIREAERYGCKLKVFNRMPWRGIMRWGRMVRLLRNIRKAIIVLNRRTHRKLCIIDGTSAFLGSMNIIEYHCQQYVGARAWRDTGIYVQGEDVCVLQDDFLRLWRKKRRRKRLGRRQRKEMIESGRRIKLNSKRRLREQNYVDLLVLVLGAQSRIWVETAYFVPDRRLVQALRTVAESGVDVRIMVPAQADVFFIPWVASAFHNSLLSAGVRVFEYTKTMLHAKTILVDAHGVVGSSNLNHRSLFHDLEADVHFDDKEAVDSLQKQFVEDMQACREVVLDSWYERPVLQRFVGRILLLARAVL